MLKKPLHSLGLLFIAILFCLTGYSQSTVATSYTFSNGGDKLMTFITGGTVLGTHGQTTAVYPAIPIGFNFTFNGVTYTQVGVSNSGFIWFGATAPAATVTSPISDNTGEDGVISAFGSTLQGASTSSLSYQTSGTAPNRTFTVQWENYVGFGYNDGNNRFDLQIVLNECSNVINISATGWGYLWDAGFFITGQVGMRGASNSDFLNRTENCTGTSKWENTNAGVTNTATCSMGSTGSGSGCWPGNKVLAPGEETEFIYTPVGSTPCTGNYISTGAVAGPFCPCSPVTVSFTSSGPFTSANTYTVQLSDKNGSFASPDSIGGANNDSLLSGTIACTIPCNAIAGTGYRIRVVSNTPAITGSDNGVNITIDSLAMPTVTIASNKGTEVCAGTTVTFTATPTFGGSGPSYQWFKNGTSVAVNGTGIYTDNTLNNGDVIVVQMLSNYPCALVSIVNSDTLTITVDTTSVAPSVTVAASPGTSVCQGTTVTFTASPLNGGSSPSYQWTLNGSNVGTNSSSYSNNALHDGDRITVRLTSSLSCITVPSAIGNIITMSVAALPAAPVALAGSGATTTSFSANWRAVATATEYFLDVSVNSSFTSFVSGYNNLNVGNVLTYSVTGLSSGTDYYYRVRAGNTCTGGASSNTIGYSTLLPGGCSSATGGTIVPAVSVVCLDSTETLTLIGPTSGSVQWQVSNDNSNWSDISGATDLSYTTPALTQKQYYRCTVDVPSCFTVSSTSATVNISASPVVSITNVTSTSATVSWTPFSPGQDDIFWSGAGSGSVTGATTNPYTITGLTPNSTLAVVVTEASGCAGVTPSAVVAQTLCAAPSIINIVALPSPASGFQVTWSSVPGTTDYRVYYFNITASAASWSFVDTTDTLKTISSLVPGATYAVYVVAKNCPAAGELGEGSGVLYVSTNPASTCTPAPVVTATSNCPNGISVNVSGTPPFYITARRISPSLTYSVNFVSGSSSINLSIGNIGTGSVWEIYARSRCTDGTYSAVSNVVDVSVKSACPQVSNLVISDITCNGFVASWNPDSCGALPVSFYELLVKKNGVLNFNGYNTGTNAFYQVNWLNPSTSYNVAVLAVACNGSVSPFSAIQTIALPACRNDVEANNPATSSDDSKESVMIYPNPTSGQMFIDIGRTENAAADVKIELINELGQFIQTDFTQMSGGHLLAPLTVPATLANGIYFVKTSVGANIYVNRVMISR